ERAAGLDILQHRGLVGADALGAGDALVDSDTEGDAELLGDGLGLAHHPRGEMARLGELADIDQRRMGERADRVEGEIAPRLEPDLGADVLEDAGLEPGADEEIVDALDALRLAAVELADR